MGSKIAMIELERRLRLRLRLRKKRVLRIGQRVYVIAMVAMVAKLQGV